MQRWTILEHIGCQENEIGNVRPGAVAIDVAGLHDRRLRAILKHVTCQKHKVTYVRAGAVAIYVQPKLKTAGRLSR